MPAAVLHMQSPHTKMNLKLLAFKFGTYTNSCMNLCFKFNTTLTQSGTCVQDWPYPMLPKTLQRLGLPAQRRHWRRWTTCSRTTQLPAQELYPWDPSSLQGVHGKVYATTSRTKGYFPGRGHRVSMDHRKYDPSELGHLNMQSCQNVFRNGFSFLFNFEIF